MNLAPVAPATPATDVVGSILFYERILKTEPGQRLVALLQGKMDPMDAIRVMLAAGDCYTLGEQSARVAPAIPAPMPAADAAPILLAAAVDEPVGDRTLLAAAIAAPPPSAAPATMGVMTAAGSLETDATSTGAAKPSQRDWLLKVAVESVDGKMKATDHHAAFSTLWPSSTIHQPASTLVQMKLLARTGSGEYQITPLGRDVQAGRKNMPSVKKPGNNRPAE